uniref:Uncharacterized protein n=1 Tax=Cucumis melo TaxID=3656 RepID=A0A9I9EIA1_CUCME
MVRKEHVTRLLVSQFSLVHRGYNTMDKSWMIKYRLFKEHEEGVIHIRKLEIDGNDQSCKKSKC